MPVFYDPSGSGLLSNNPDLGWSTTDPYAAQTAFEIDSSGTLAQDAAFAPNLAILGEGALGYGPALLGAGAMGTNIWMQGNQFGLWGHSERPSTMLPAPGAQTPAPPYNMSTTSLRPGLQPGYDNDPWASNTLGPNQTGAS